MITFGLPKIPVVPTGKVILYFLTLLLTDCCSLHCITGLLEGLAASECLLWAQPSVDYSQEAREKIHQQTVVINDVIAATKDVLVDPVLMPSMCSVHTMYYIGTCKFL